MTVPPPLIAVNRTQLMTLVATNFFGQNTAAIAATELEYAEMWAQDALAMYGYAANAAAATASVIPFTAGAANHQYGRAGRAGGFDCPVGRHVGWRRAVDAVTTG